jgi:hypothetical protein
MAADTKDSAKLSLVFDRTKETKGTHVFEERPSANGGRPTVGKVYVTKEALVGLGYPHSIRVTIEAGE